MKPVDEYLDRSSSMDEASFTAELADGVLLCEPDAPAGDPLSVTPVPTKLDLETDKLPRWMRGARTPGNEVYFVLPLVKRAGVPLPDRILVGRTDLNDLVIPHLTVSRAHGFFTLGAERSVVDTGSKQGTWVRDERIVAHEPVAIASGTRIRFGAVRTMYLSAARFYEYCRARVVADRAQRTMDGAIDYKP